MEDPAPRRRERLRAETVRDIKAIALRHMAAGGPAALSLRGIARDMGMTAGALYSYYDTRDDLITALVTDIYTAVADRLEAARAAGPPGDPGAALAAVATTYRAWAIAHPQEFQLLYGDPIPGYQFPTGGDASYAEQQACGVLLRLVEAAWPRLTAPGRAPATDPGPDAVEWSDLTPEFAAMARASFPDLPPAAVALALRIWGRLHGLLALEIYGHLRPHAANPAKLYRAEVRDLAVVLGVGPGSAGPSAAAGPEAASTARIAATTGPGSSAR